MLGRRSACHSYSDPPLAANQSSLAPTPGIPAAASTATAMHRFDGCRLIGSGNLHVRCAAAQLGRPLQAVLGSQELTFTRSPDSQCAIHWYATTQTGVVKPLKQVLKLARVWVASATLPSWNNNLALEKKKTGAFMARLPAVQSHSLFARHSAFLPQTTATACKDVLSLCQIKQMRDGRALTGASIRLTDSAQWLEMKRSVNDFEFANACPTS